MENHAFLSNVKIFVFYKGINTYHDKEKIAEQYSVTQFLTSDPKKIPDICLEQSNAKEMNVYIFENKVES